MSIQVRIPTPLRKFTKGEALVTVDGGDVAELLIVLARRFPGIDERLRDENGDLRRFINIYVNEEDIRFLTGLNTPVRPGDDVSIVPAISGG